MTDEGKLGGTMGFATLRPTFPEASAQLVELMRATLRHAQEITAAVGEAEGAAKRAQAAVATVDAATTQVERRVVESEIEKLSTWLAPPKQPDSGTTDKGTYRSALAASMPSALSATSQVTTSSAIAQQPSLATSATSALPSGAPAQNATTDAAAVAGQEDGPSSGTGNFPLASSGLDGGLRGESESAAVQGARLAESLRDKDGTGKPSVALEMAEEIETTVMWVQQLLESVHFIDSDTPLEPGASLLSIVQPGRRHQKDIALDQSKVVFREKKEAEEEDDDLNTAIFRRLRGEALQAVSAQRTTMSSRE